MSSRIALLPDERVVMSSDKDILTLTTRRVRYDSTLFGSSLIISITLDSIASCGLVTKSHPILLLLAAAALIGAWVIGALEGILLGAVLVVFYFLTRRAVISIASNGGQTILCPTKGMDRSVIIEFLEAVEREKLQRNA